MANFATNSSGAKFLAGEIAQVKESIPWVRCASGNVYDCFDKKIWIVLAKNFVHCFVENFLSSF